MSPAGERDWLWVAIEIEGIMKGEEMDRRHKRDRRRGGRESYLGDGPGPGVLLVWPTRVGSQGNAG